MISSLLSSFGPYVAAAFAAVVAFIYGLFQKRSADKAKAEAATTVAKTQAAVAQAQAAAAQAVTEASKVRQDVEAKTNTPTEVSDELKKWIRD